MLPYLNPTDVEIVVGTGLISGKANAFFEKYGVSEVKTDFAFHKKMLDDTLLRL